MRVFLFGCILFFLGVPLHVVGVGLPKEILITNKSAKELGFYITLDDQSSGSELWVVSLSFPISINKNWKVARVQTYLIDKSENELSGTSFDYVISSGEPELLFHFQPKINDMVVVIQYFCPDGGGYGCAEAYTIESVIDYFKP